MPRPRFYSFLYSTQEVLVVLQQSSLHVRVFLNRSLNLLYMSAPFRYFILLLPL